MTQYVGEEFDAVVSGVSAFGFWAETIEQKCEGMIHVSALLDIDTFEFAEPEYALVGKHTGMRFTIGDKLKVRVERADLEKRQIDFALASMPEQKKRRAEKEKPAKQSKAAPAKKKKTR
jgi:ribonuclease R